MEKRGLTSLFSVLTKCIEEVPVAWASCSCEALIVTFVEGSEGRPVLSRLCPNKQVEVCGSRANYRGLAPTPRRRYRPATRFRMRSTRGPGPTLPGKLRPARVCYLFEHLVAYAFPVGA